jgi:hypothetical protein
MGVEAFASEEQHTVPRPKALGRLRCWERVRVPPNIWQYRGMCVDPCNWLKVGEGPTHLLREGWETVYLPLSLQLLLPALKKLRPLIVQNCLVLLQTPSCLGLHADGCVVESLRFCADESALSCFSWGLYPSAIYLLNVQRVGLLHRHMLRDDMPGTQRKIKAN